VRVARGPLAPPSRNQASTLQQQRRSRASRDPRKGTGGLASALAYDTVGLVASSERDRRRRLSQATAIRLPAVDCRSGRGPAAERGYLKRRAAASVAGLAPAPAGSPRRLASTDVVEIQRDRLRLTRCRPKRASSTLPGRPVAFI
jgi:hypothetical protein